MCGVFATFFNDRNLILVRRCDAFESAILYFRQRKVNGAIEMHESVCIENVHKRNHDV